jgi:mitotic spindle assembly checkpoint protein MAD2
MTTGSEVAQKTTITLRGSTALVVEFFAYAINSILYQRGIYPPETFVRKQKYGLSMLVSNDEGLKEYLGNVLTQLSTWMMHRSVQKLVLVICGSESGATLERWVFDVQHDKSATKTTGPDGDDVVGTKSEKEIMGEIQAIIRQITASVTFLPLLSEACTFDLLVYTDKECSVPVEWEESDPKYIAQSSEVKLRSFTTSVHKVDTMVSYKMD